MVDDNTVLEFESEEYRWIAIIVKDNKIRGGIFTDIKRMSKQLRISDKTIRRRLKEMNGLGRIKINGYTIQQMPYFKSNRGPNNENQ